MPKVQTAVSIFLTVAGAAAIAIVPYEEWTSARDRRAVSRAGEPLAKAAVGAVREPTIAFSEPSDRQWRGLVRRLGRPTFLLVVDAEPGALRSLSVPVATDDIVVEGTQNNRTLEITATQERPFQYPSHRHPAAFSFEVSSLEVVRLSVRGESAPLPSDAFLMVFPGWDHSRLRRLGGGFFGGGGVFELIVAPPLLLLGAVLIYFGGLVKRVL